MVKQVVKWQTKDGSEFDTEAEAKEYEDSYEIIDKISNLIYESPFRIDREDSLELAKKLYNSFDINF